jgi:hypothetical protein
MHQYFHQSIFTFFLFNCGVRKGFLNGSKVADLLRNIGQAYPMGGSQAHRFAKRSPRLVLCLTTPHIRGYLFRSSSQPGLPARLLA